MSTNKGFRIDLTGKTFNRLTAIKYVGSAKWLFACRCGNERILGGYEVANGRIKSCGCLKNEQCRNINLKKPGEAAFTNLYLGYVHGAKQRNYDFQLSKKFVREIVKQPCYYCGSAPSQIKEVPSGNGVFIYNGIDRLDNDVGYLESNVVPCCWTCNNNKGTKTVNEFLGWIKDVYLHRCQNTNGRQK